jgi:putative flippase GtrA
MNHRTLVKKLGTHQVIRYLLIGGLAFVVEMAAIYGLKIIGLSDLHAVAISFWIGFIVAFLLQKYFTFKNSARDIKSISHQLIGYSLLVGLNYLFTLSVVGYFSGALAVYTLRAIVIAITTVWNYLVYKYIFRKQ